jgi:predicted ribosome quality control (RQC) complex YloA/Tae2 family protein
MSMPFDTMALAAVADEVSAATGGQIQRIIQPSAASIALAIYSGGDRRWLVMSADARYARVQFSGERLAKAFATPSSFVMLLRKYFEGGRLHGVEQVPFERILILTLGRQDHHVRLVTEIMGKHSNIILLDDSDTILGAIKLVPPRLSRVRPILPGRTYEPPPARGRDPSVFPPGDRVDPSADLDLFAGCLSSIPSGHTIKSALLGILPGCSPFMAEQIARYTGLDPSKEIKGAPADRIASSALDLYSRLESHRWEPCTFLSHAGSLDYAPYHPAAVDDVAGVATMSEAIERSMGDAESRDVLGSARQEFLQSVERARRAAERRMSSLREGLAAAADPETVMQQGQLILAYQHQLAPNDVELHIPELETTISLDPLLSAKANAERAFHRYRKLRDARKRIPGLLQRAESEAQRLDDLIAFTRLAETESDLRELRREAGLNGSESRRQTTKKKASRGPLRYTLSHFTALVGRNARENEEVTFRLARRDDLWLHARGRTGAHVILQGAHPPEDVVLAAAAVAAYHSEGRSDSAVDVDVAAARDVRKMPGAAPGRVTYRNHRTLRVAPALGEWMRL